MIDPQLAGRLSQFHAALNQLHSLAVKLCVVAVPLHYRRVFGSAGHATIALAACFRQACLVLPGGATAFGTDFRFHALIIAHHLIRLTPKYPPKVGQVYPFVSLVVRQVYLDGFGPLLLDFLQLGLIRNVILTQIQPLILDSQ